jgi:hypothetical protein
MESVSDYRKAYESAKRDLAKVIADQEVLEKKKLALRKTIEALAAQCEGDQVAIDPSPDAAYLLAETTLADEIRTILQAHEWLRPHQIKIELEGLGHDLTKYENPQAAIQMVLKRMVESEEVYEKLDNDGKKVYRRPGHFERTVKGRYRDSASLNSTGTNLLIRPGSSRYRDSVNLLARSPKDKK